MHSAALPLSPIASTGADAIDRRLRWKLMQPPHSSTTCPIGIDALNMLKCKHSAQAFRLGPPSRSSSLHNDLIGGSPQQHLPGLRSRCCYTHRPGTDNLHTLAHKVCYPHDTNITCSSMAARLGPELHVHITTDIAKLAAACACMAAAVHRRHCLNCTGRANCHEPG
jgi:hypothetical protein